jgi:hypothetical protein
VIFLEVTLSDLLISAPTCSLGAAYATGARILAMSSPVIANSITALLLHLRDTYHVRPNIYFEWSEGNPLANLLRFLCLGVGEIAPVTREVLGLAEPDPTQPNDPRNT